MKNLEEELRNNYSSPVLNLPYITLNSHNIVFNKFFKFSGIFYFLNKKLIQFECNDFTDYKYIILNSSNFKTFLMELKYIYKSTNQVVDFNTWVYNCLDLIVNYHSLKEYDKMIKNIIRDVCKKYIIVRLSWNDFTQYKNLLIEPTEENFKFVKDNFKEYVILNEELS